MLNISICDDDTAVCQQLSDYILRFEEETGQKMQATIFSSGAELLSDYPCATDILLLDIEMGSPNGIETAQRLRLTVPDLCIIFITGYNQYAVKGYSVRAFGFLPKPVSYFTFRNELTLAIEQLQRRSSHFIFIKNYEEGSVHQLNVKDICYFEARDHTIAAITEKHRLHYRGTLNALEQELAQHGFFRCHAAFLVNQRYIASIGQDLILTDRTIIPVSRHRRKEFLTALSAYIGEML